MLHLQELIRLETGRAKLGEELFNPQVESLLIDQKIKAVVNHDLGNGDAGLFVLDGFFVGLSMGRPVGLMRRRKCAALAWPWAIKLLIISLSS
mgnify:CR=1 FL=1